MATLSSCQGSLGQERHAALETIIDGKTKCADKAICEPANILSVLHQKIGTNFLVLLALLSV